jgi:ABC-type tungstate transport system permease subunit
MTARRLLIAFTLLLGLSASADAQERSIIVASTTSSQDSGLHCEILVSVW